VNDSGVIEAEEFFLGCLRIKGTGRGIDMANLMYFNKRIAVWWADRLDAMDDALESIVDLLQTTTFTASGSSASRYDRRTCQHGSVDLRKALATWSDLQHIGDQRVQEILGLEARKERYGKVLDEDHGTRTSFFRRLMHALARLSPT